MYDFNALAGNFDKDTKSHFCYTEVIPGSTTSAVDIETFADFESAKYYVRIKRLSDGRIRTFTLSVIKRGSSLRESLYARIGGALSVAVDTAVNGADYELQITNNNLGDIEITYLKSAI